jgi:hypothetical protein
VAHMKARDRSQCRSYGNLLDKMALEQVSLPVQVCARIHGNKFKDLPRLCETADNTERYSIQGVRGGICNTSGECSLC